MFAYFKVENFFFKIKNLLKLHAQFVQKPVFRVNLGL